MKIRDNKNSELPEFQSWDKKALMRQKEKGPWRYKLQKKIELNFRYNHLRYSLAFKVMRLIFLSERSEFKHKNPH